MSRPTRYPPSRTPVLVVAFVAALLGVGVPSSVATLFHAHAPHLDAPATAKAVARDASAG